MRPGVLNRQPGGRADRYRIDDPHPLLGTLYLHDNHPLEPTLRPTPYRRLPGGIRCHAGGDAQVCKSGSLGLSSRARSRLLEAGLISPISVSIRARIVQRNQLERLRSMARIIQRRAAP